MALEEAGTQADPFLIETVQDILDIDAADTSAGTEYFRLENNITVNGEIPRFTFYGDFDLNGFAIDGITSFQFGALFNSLEGRIHNGELGFNVTTNDGGGETVFNSVESSATIENMKFSGTITASGTEEACIIRTLRSSNMNNVLFAVDLSVVDGIAAPIDGSVTVSVDKCVNTGTMTVTGTGTAYGLSNSTSVSSTNCFYDTTKNGGLTDSNGVTGKTTTELQDIDTYTNTATTGLSSAYDMVALGSYVDETWAIDDGAAYPILGFEVEPVVLQSGTITLSGVAQANAVVDIISCPTVSEGTKTIVEQVTANGSGVYTATVERNTALNYWAEPRHYVEEFTGTLTPVSGTTFSTGVDLTGVSIGGANDPLYVLKSTGGTASGEEVVVESRSGNDITLSYDPGFDGTTTFSLGKAYGTNTVLARSTVS